MLVSISQIANGLAFSYTVEEFSSVALAYPNRQDLRYAYFKVFFYDPSIRATGEVLFQAQELLIP